MISQIDDQSLIQQKEATAKRRYKFLSNVQLVNFYFNNSDAYKFTC